MDGQAAAWGRVGFASQGMRCMEREEVAMCILWVAYLCYNHAAHTGGFR